MITDGEIVYALLAADTDVAALVSTRIYPESAPQNVTVPYITYEVSSVEHYHHMVNSSGLKAATVMVDCFAATYIAARALAEKVRLALQGYTGTVTVGGASVVVQMITLEDDSDVLIQNSGGGQVNMRLCSQDFRIITPEAVPDHT